MKLDYSLFPKMDKGYLLIPRPYEELKPFKDIYNRFCSAIYMASNIGEESPINMLSGDTKSTAYLRAALAEFVSIEDIIEQQYQNIARKDYKVYKSSNPLFHLMKLLRHYNIHLSESHISNKTICVSTEAEPGKNFEIGVSYIDNINPQKIMLLKSTKDYSNADIEKMISYFEIEQHKFGVAALILRGLITYSEVVANLLTKALKET